MVGDVIPVVAAGIIVCRADISMRAKVLAFNAFSGIVPDGPRRVASWLDRAVVYGSDRSVLRTAVGMALEYAGGPA